MRPPLSVPEQPNLTCASPMSSIRQVLANRSECQLTAPELRLELLFTFYLPMLLCVSGFLLNVLNFRIFRRQQFEGPAYAYMAAISLVDALFLVFYTSYVVTALRCQDHPGEFPCRAKAFHLLRSGLAFASVYVTTTANFTLQTVCAWLTVILGIERYMAMKYFHFRRTRCHRTDTKFTIVCVCCLSFMFNLPNSFTSGIAFNNRVAPGGNATIRFITIEQTRFGSSLDYSAYSFIKLACTTVLPFALLAVNNTMLLFLVLRHQRANSANQPRQAEDTAVKRTSKVLQASLSRIRAQKNLTILLIVVIFVFLAGQVPRSLLLKDIFAFIYPHCPCGTSLLWLCCPLYRRLHPLSEVVYLLCLNLNFFIYLGLNQHFREHIRLPRLGQCRTSAAQGGDGCRPRNCVEDDHLAVRGARVDRFSAAGATTCDCSPTQSCHWLGPQCEAPLRVRQSGAPLALRRHSCAAPDCFEDFDDDLGDEELAVEAVTFVQHHQCRRSRSSAGSLRSLGRLDGAGSGSGGIGGGSGGGGSGGGAWELDGLLGYRPIMVSQL